MTKLDKYMDGDRGGFAISFEICMTMLIVAFVASVTIYFAQVFELQRYFADVTASTCTMASRYGGNESTAYKIQVGQGSIEDNANLMLSYLNNQNESVAFQTVDSSGKFISVSDYPDDNGNVQVSMAYKLGNIGWGALANIVSPSGTITMSFELPSLIQTGKLIR